MWNWKIVGVVLLQKEPPIEGVLTFEVQAANLDDALAKGREVAADYDIVELVQGDEVVVESKS